MTAATYDFRSRAPEPGHRRTFQPVRRDSQLAGREKWPHFTWKQGRRILLAARMKAEKLRQPGQRTGADGTISFGALRLLELMVQISARGKGRLEPSVAWMAKALNVPLKSIHAWKGQLKAHGFLKWRRRYVSTDRPGVRGPQVEQTSNAYWLEAPAADLKRADKVIMPRAPEESRAEMADRLRRVADEHEAESRLARALGRIEAHVEAEAARAAQPNEGT